MNHKSLFALAGVTAFFSVTGFAGTMGAQTDTAHNAGWNIGADIGFGYLNTQEEDILAPVPITVPQVTEIQSQSHSIGHVIGGGYLGYDVSISERLSIGMEGGYKYLGQSHYKSYAADTVSSNYFDNNIKVNQQAIDFLLSGRLLFWRNISFIGKAGVAYVRSQTKATSNFNVISFEGGLPTDVVIWRIKPEVNLGVGYSINQHVDLNLMYIHIGGTDANVPGYTRYYNATPDKLPGVFEYNGLSVGLSYTFG